MIRALAAIGITQVQMHEPALVTTAASTLRSDYEMAYSYIANLDLAVRTTLVSYYDDLEEEVCLWASQLPVDGLQLDFIGVPGAASSNRNLAHVIRHGFPSDKDLIAGVVDGRSVYADLGGSQARSILQALVSKGKVDPSRIIVSSSCSLQHLPFSLEAEEKIDPELRAKLAFAVEKVAEIKSAARGWSDSLPMTLVKPALESGSGKTLNTVDADSVREPFEIRRPKQMPFLPPFPTTTIGSFPQTKEIRSARALYRSGKITKEEYDVQMGAHIAYSVGVQEGLGIDVLVHGEAERTDMVEYFGEQLDGFHFTTNAWVQSYGSRCVKPPIIVGDVRFVRPMTVDTFRLAQSLTRKPMKGMLTGPVTILNWSFARKDVTRAMQCNQIAQAIRQEVAALEEAGAIVIQVRVFGISTAYSSAEY